MGHTYVKLVQSCYRMSLFLTLKILSFYQGGTLKREFKRKQASKSTRQLRQLLNILPCNSNLKNFYFQLLFPYQLTNSILSPAFSSTSLFSQDGYHIIIIINNKTFMPETNDISYNKFRISAALSFLAAEQLNLQQQYPTKLTALLILPN